MVRKKFIFGALAVPCIVLFLFLHYQPAKKIPLDHIQKFYRYRNLQKVFDMCDEHTLITFDVDDTLLASKDVLARTYTYPFWLKLRAVIRHPCIFLGNEEKFLDFFSVILQQAERFVFDPEVTAMIKKLQHQRVPVIALTSMETGSMGVIHNMQEWRARMLKSFDIDFTGHFADTTFTKFPRYRGNVPVLYKGILCANQADKGAVLGAFLDLAYLTPKRIISFDDQESALLSIAEECKQRGIPWWGYQGLGVSLIPGTFSIQRALLQIDTVVQDKHWLSDSVADAILAGTMKLA